MHTNKDTFRHLVKFKLFRDFYNKEHINFRNFTMKKLLTTIGSFLCLVFHSHVPRYTSINY